MIRYRMEIRANNTHLLDWTGDILALGLFEEQLELTSDLATLDEKLSFIIKELIDETDFKAKEGSNAITRVPSKSPIRKIILLGLGKLNQLKLDTLRITAASAAKLALKQKAKTLALSLPIYDDNPLLSTQAIVEGIELGLHQDLRFKSESENKSKRLESVELLGFLNTQDAIDKAHILCSGVILTRELVGAPANSVTPITMAEVAQKIATDYGLEIKILEKNECEKLGMGAFLGVAQASDFPPKFIHLTYKPSGTPKRKLAIVGKGITFDSGGLNIKTTGSGIEHMKVDMGGAGAILGAAKAIAQLKPTVEVHFISAVTDNMINAKALHPGDIVTASNGKTIEINNTDAEGRLTLADALVYAEQLGVDGIIDLATLTGACVTALGNDYAGLWTTNQDLANEILAASQVSGEKIWQMPLEEKYFESMKSSIADMKNAGGRAGGAISAAAFLKQFIKDTPWVHLDIAGPVYTEKDNGINYAGATGYGVRTLVNWVVCI